MGSILMLHLVPGTFQPLSYKMKAAIRGHIRVPIDYHRMRPINQWAKSRGRDRVHDVVVYTYHLRLEGEVTKQLVLVLIVTIVASASEQDEKSREE